MDFGFKITDLAKMLNEVDPDRRHQKDSDSEDEPGFKLGNQGPGDIAPKSKSATSTSDTSTKKIKSNEIQDSVANGVNQNQEDKEDFIQNDPRQSPTYEMHYRQSVTTEDMFLQMGNKTSGTASCENLVVEIYLPQDDFQSIQLNLKKQAIDLQSPIHCLHLNLPHPIDPRAGNAKWDNEKEKLIITLVLSREFDEFNF